MLTAITALRIGALPVTTSVLCPALVAAFATKKSITETLSEKVSIASKRKKEKPEPSSPTQPAKKKEKAPRALSAYTFFIKEQVPKLGNDPSIPRNERFRYVSQQWKGLSDAEKAPYQQLAAESKANSEAIRAERKAQGIPLNPYAKYVSEIMSSLRATHPDRPAPELMKLAAESWKLVSAGEKERRQQQYRDAKNLWKAQQDAAAPQAA